MEWTIRIDFISVCAHQNSAGARETGALLSDPGTGAGIRVRSQQSRAQPSDASVVGRPASFASPSTTTSDRCC